LSYSCCAKFKFWYFAYRIQVRIC